MTQGSYSFRIKVTFFVFLMAYLVIVGNFFYIQYVCHERYNALGDKQYRVTATLFPPRGIIYDRHGALLATNRDSVAAFVVPREVAHNNEVKNFLKKHFPHALQHLEAAAKSQFMYVGRNLSDDQVQAIELSGISEIHLLHEPSRYYPAPCATGVVGITDIDNKGIMGIEYVYNDLLSGSPTIYYLENDARSKRYYFKKEAKQIGRESCSLRLTIDATVQFLVYEELHATVDHFHAQEGAVIIIDPQTGEVIALANVPTFDPNVKGTRSTATAPALPITQEYELGSVMKTFSALAALAEGVVTLDELIDCQNVETAYIDGCKVNTRPRSTIAGVIPFCEVIAKSNNIGIAKVVKRIGVRLYDHYLRLGFGKKTGIQFPGERAGFVNKPDNWSKQSIFSLAYGYEITATLLQLAQAFCIIARGGYLVRPTLIIESNGLNLGSPVDKGERLYTQETIALIRKILETTVLQGSARKTRIEGYTIMSKTGTANILENGMYNKDRNIYTCAGIVEKGDYQRVIVTFIRECAQKNLYAATVTVPLFEKVATRLLIHDKIL